MRKNRTPPLSANPETPGLDIAVDRALGLRGSLHDFVRMAWHVVEPGGTYKDNWHIDVICSYLEKVSRGECRQLIINVPPGSMKSLLVCVFWPVWDWLRNPTRRWLFSSFDQSLTVRDAGKALLLVCSDWFTARWHEYKVPVDSAKGFYENNCGGWRFATSVEGKTTGHHPDMVIVDDPTKPKDASPENLRKVQDWWRTTMLSRGRDQSTVCRVLIMQRLHEEDLAGYLQTKEKGWQVLSFPMRYETEGANANDPRTEEGEIFWSERYPQNVVDTMRENLGARIDAAQNQQRPAPEKGLVFERAWMSNRWTTIPERWEDSCLSWDFSFKGNDGSDWVVGQAWIKSGGKFYLIDQVRKKLGFVDASRAFEDMCAKHPKIFARLIEDKANGTAIEDQLKKKIPGIILIEPRGSKLARASAVAPFFQAGNVVLPDAAPWVQDYVEEFACFPTGSHDDQVDATSQALDRLGIRARDLAAAMKNAGAFLTLD